MSQFDETTKSKSKEWRERIKSRLWPKYGETDFNLIEESFIECRNQDKESLKILAKAIVELEKLSPLVENSGTKAIAAVKARGDWPLEERND
jgi:hypothetical protein